MPGWGSLGTRLNPSLSKSDSVAGPSTALLVSFLVPPPQSSLPTHVFQKSDYEVWRRYKDFEWLRDIMEKAHPTLIVPVSVCVHVVSRVWRPLNFGL